MDFVVHVFSQKARNFYNLERLWKSAKQWTPGELRSLPRKRARAKSFDACADAQPSFAPPRPQGLDATPAAVVSPGSAAATVVHPPPAPAGAILQSWIAADPVSLDLLREIRGIALSASTVLMRGESGTGKDLLASVLHYLGPHPEAPLLRINCAELPRAAARSRAVRL